MNRVKNQKKEKIILKKIRLNLIKELLRIFDKYIKIITLLRMYELK